MKKILLIIIAVLTAGSSWAEFVRPETAAQYARDILGMKDTPAPEGSTALRAPGRDGQNAPEYYIFNNPDGGWVIIAADDRVNPVIGYSDQGTFMLEGMPDNIRWWMDGVAETIDAVRKEAAESSLAVRPEWKKLSGGTGGGSKVQLTTAQWGQEEPYNNLCPVVTGENVRSVTGCVATSMAIIMRYNKWPEHGAGVIGGYTTSTSETYIPAYSIDDHVYNWDAMPLTNGSRETAYWTSEQKNQVAQLMHDCGVASNMDYTPEASSTSSGDMLKAIQTNMSYSESSALICRASYTLDEWFSIIKNEIDMGRVVYYAGEGDAGGHAFVCDGYDTDGSKLRINWGWGGTCNGFFTLDLAIPDAGVSFPDAQEAIIGLAPDTAQVDLDNVISMICVDYNNFYGIEPIVPADITKGSEFNFLVGWFMNTANRDIDAEFMVRLEDKDGNMRQEGWNVSMTIPAANGYIYNEETAKTLLTVNPELTDHFRLYMKNGKGEWEPMRGNHDVLPNVEGVICGVVQDPVIVVPDGCAAGDIVDLSLSLGFTHVKSVSWSLNGTGLEGNRVELVQGRNDIRADVEYLDSSTGSIYLTLQLE